MTLDVGDKLVNTDDTALTKYEKKFMQKVIESWAGVESEHIA